MPAPRFSLLVASTACLALTVASSAEAARPPVGKWSGPARYVSAPGGAGIDGDGAAPRVAVAADGTAGMVYELLGRQVGLRLVARRSTGRFGKPVVVSRRFPRDFSIAAAGRGVVTVAWVDPHGVHSAQLRDGQLTRHELVAGKRSAIDSIQLARDPRGGYVVATTQFAAHKTRVAAQNLGRDGAAVGPPTDLGEGNFGNTARETAALTVDSSGTAYFAYQAPNDLAGSQTIVRARPRGGAWTAGTTVPVTDARLSVNQNVALVTGTAPARFSEVATFGTPSAYRLAADGAVGPAIQPSGVEATRAFQPSAVSLYPGRLLFLFSQRAEPRAFSITAPVLSRTLEQMSGATTVSQQLTGSPDAAEPYLTPVLSTGGAVALWSGPRGWGAAQADGNGRMRAIRPPAGPPPTLYHSNATNRDIRSAGSYVAVAWQRDSRVSVSVLRAH